MKTLITRDMVADAIKKLADAGQKATLQAIHAALGGKGSLTTLIKLKAEIEQATSAPQDSAEGLTQFRTLWAAAVAEGRKSMEAQMTELRAGLDALTIENERLEAAAIADAARVAEALAQRDKLVDELSQANRAATDARAAGADAAGRLAAALADLANARESAANEWKDAHAMINKHKDRAHALEIENAKLAEQARGAEERRKIAEAYGDRMRKEAEETAKEFRRLESAAMDRDHIQNQLDQAKEEIKRLSKARKPGTPRT